MSIKPKQISIFDYIQSRKQMYNKLFDKDTFDMFFSNKPISQDELKKITYAASQNMFNLIRGGQCNMNFFLEIPSTLSHNVFSTDHDNFIGFKNTANFIYVHSNCSTNFYNDQHLLIHYLKNDENNHNNIIVISSDNVAKFIGIVNNGIIDWNCSIKINNNVFLRLGKSPTKDINDKIISKLVISNMNMNINIS